MRNPEDFDRETHFQPRELVDYLQGCIADAVNQEILSQRDETTPRASFYVRHTLAIDRLPETIDTIKVVLKDPHPHDKPGDYSEVFVANDFDTNEELTVDEVGRVFYIRNFRGGQVESFMYADDEGSVGADEIADILFDTVPTDRTQHRGNAEELFRIVGRRNIVAVDY